MMKYMLDTNTNADLFSVIPRAIRLDPEHPEPTAFHMHQRAHVFECASRFDIIHCHLDYLPFSFIVDKTDRAYFESEIRPLLEDSSVDFLGEIPESEKIELLQDAAALIFPIEWLEPFGLVMIEAKVDQGEDNEST
jgi:hypothetical protein